jgi:hypothetical protein
VQTSTQNTTHHKTKNEIKTRQLQQEETSPRSGATEENAPVSPNLNSDLGSEQTSNGYGGAARHGVGKGIGHASVINPEPIAMIYREMWDRAGTFIWTSCRDGEGDGPVGGF